MTGNKTQTSGIGSANQSGEPPSFTSDWRVRSLMEISPDGVCLFGTDGCLREVNQAYCQMFGYSEEELVGMSLAELEVDETEQDIADHIRRAKQAGGDRFETRNRHKDGAIIDIEVTTKYIEQDQDAFFIAVVRDITQAKRDRARLDQLNRLLHTISAIDSVIVRTQDSQQVLEELCRILVQEGGYRMAWVGLADFATGEVTPVAHAGLEQGYLERIKVRCDDSPLGRGPTGSALRSARHVINMNIEDDSDFRSWRDSALQRGYHASAAFPFRVHGQVKGAINVYADYFNAFNPQEVKLLCELADNIGYALQTYADAQSHKRVEQAHSESEERFRRAFDDAPIGMALVDLADTIFQANHSLGEILGYSQQELVGMRVAQITHPDDVNAEVTQKQKIKQGDGAQFVMEKRYLHKSGKIVWGRLSVTAINDSAGKPFYFIGQLQDITESKLTERALRESEERMRMFSELSYEGIVIHDNGVVLDANEHLAHMLGYEPHECIGRSGLDFTAPESRELVMKNISSDYQEPYEVLALRKDGSTFPLELIARTVPYKGKTARVTIMRDISARKQSDAKLLQREAQLAEAQHIAHLGSWEWDAKIQAISLSDEMYQIFVLEKNATNADFLRALNTMLAAEDITRLQQAWHSLHAGDRPLPLEIEMTTPDGMCHTLWIEASVTRNRNAGVEKVIGTVQDATERKLAEEALRQSEDRFSKAFHNSPALLAISSLKEGRLLDCNDSFLRIIGYSRAEIIGRTVYELRLWMYPEARQQIIDILDDKGTLSGYEMEVCTKAGEIKNILVSMQTITLEGQDCILSVGTDITERKQDSEQMRKLSSALEQTADSVMVTDKKGIIEYVNPAFEQVTGYSRVDAIGGKSNIVRSDMHDRDFYHHLWGTILKGEVFSDIMINRKRDGSLYYEEKTITPLLDDNGEITHFVSTGKDITERMQTQERLQYLAHHDVLTELPNRVLFADRLDQGLARARWHDRAVAVMFLDLDRFKIINDTLGHDVGDRTLQAVSEALNAAIRSGDTVARVGGDEFAIILEDIASADDVAPVARKILQNLAKPFVVDERELYVTTSIGISLFPGDGNDSQSLLKHADIAMYRAKEQGRNTYQFYSSDMGAKAFERLSLETSLRHALARDEFCLFYQPQVDLFNGRIIGIEALLRWRHPDLGIVAPADFIPLLEETGLIVPVGEWVMRKACEHFKQWQDQGLDPKRIAINLSGRQFDEPKLAQLIDDVVQSMQFDPSWLEFEITESVLMKNKQYTIDILEVLERLGVRLAIDDFGTGYSSLSYLKRFPIDTFKIDRSFVRDVNSDPDDAAIVQAIIAMAKSLNLHVIAEGVETQEQLAFLRGLKCDAMQGFLFSRPLPVEEMTRLLQQRPKL